jgi:hypothetical protein
MNESLIIGEIKNEPSNQSLGEEERMNIKSCPKQKEQETIIESKSKYPLKEVLQLYNTHYFYFKLSFLTLLLHTLLIIYAFISDSDELDCEWSILQIDKCINQRRLHFNFNTTYHIISQLCLTCVIPVCLIKLSSLWLKNKNREIKSKCDDEISKLDAYIDDSDYCLILKNLPDGVKQEELKTWLIELHQFEGIQKIIYLNENLRTIVKLNNKIRRLVKELRIFESRKNEQIDMNEREFEKTRRRLEKLQETVLNKSTEKSKFSGTVVVLLNNPLDKKKFFKKIPMKRKFLTYVNTYTFRFKEKTVYFIDMPTLTFVDWKCLSKNEEEFYLNGWKSVSLKLILVGLVILMAYLTFFFSQTNFPIFGYDIYKIYFLKSVLIFMLGLFFEQYVPFIMNFLFNNSDLYFKNRIIQYFTNMKTLLLTILFNAYVKNLLITKEDELSFDENNDYKSLALLLFLTYLKSFYSLYSIKIYLNSAKLLFFKFFCRKKLCSVEKEELNSKNELDIIHAMEMFRIIYFSCILISFKYVILASITFLFLILHHFFTRIVISRSNLIHNYRGFYFDRSFTIDQTLYFFITIVNIPLVFTEDANIIPFLNKLYIIIFSLLYVLASDLNLILSQKQGDINVVYKDKHNEITTSISKSILKEPYLYTKNVETI